jgi:hypothetical protein
LNYLPQVDGCVKRFATKVEVGRHERKLHEGLA